MAQQRIGRAELSEGVGNDLGVRQPVGRVPTLHLRALATRELTRGYWEVTRRDGMYNRRLTFRRGLKAWGWIRC